MVGLTAPGMNGALVFVLGYSEAKNRYLVALHDGLRGAKPLGIRPVNLVLKSGSAVVVQSHGQQALQGWEGKRATRERLERERTERAARLGAGASTALVGA